MFHQKCTWVPCFGDALTRQCTHGSAFREGMASTTWTVLAQWNRDINIESNGLDPDHRFELDFNTRRTGSGWSGYALDARGR